MARHSTWSETMDKQLREAYAKDENLASIAERMFMTKGQVQYRARQLGITDPNRPRRAASKEMASRWESADYRESQIAAAKNYHLDMWASWRGSRYFVVTAPDGTVYRDKDLLEFCKKHDISRLAMLRVFRGRQKQHRGWTGHFEKKK